MKKYALLFCASLLCCTTIAALDARTVELGADICGGVTNTHFSLNDLFFNDSKALNLDFNKLYRSAAPDGFVVHLDTAAVVFFNLNFGKRFSFGVFANADAVVSTAIPANVMQLLAKGNVLDEKIEGSFDIKARAFASAGISTRFSFDRLRVSVRPALYIPLLYAKSGTASYEATARADGTISAVADYSVPVYSLFSLDDPVGTFPLSDIFNKGGFDVTASVDYVLSPIVTLQTTLENIPIMPAHTEYECVYSGSVDVETNSVLSGKDIIESQTVDTKKPVTRSGVDVAVFRPLKIGFAAIFSPFEKKNIQLIPDFGLVFDNGSLDCTDFGITGSMNVSQVFDTSIFAVRRNSCWRSGVTARLDLRVIELDVSIAAHFPAVKKMFAGTGLYASIGFRLGY